MSDVSAAPTTSSHSTAASVRIEGSSGGDRAYRWATTGFALIIPVLLVLIAAEIFIAGWPALSQVRVRLFHRHGMGCCQRPLRRRAGDLRDARLVAHRTAHRNAAFRWRRDLPVRIRPTLDSSAHRVPGRPARRDSERRLWTVGHPRARAVPARQRHAVRERHAAPRRLPTVLWSSIRTKHARCRIHSRDHGAALHLRGDARSADGRAAPRSARRRSPWVRRVGR